MNLFLDIGEIAWQAIISALTIFILAKIMGSKQISQLTYFDYIVGITIGSIAASMSFEDGLPLYRPIIAMVVYAMIDILISLLSMKSIKLRKILNGASTIIMENGLLIEENMKIAKLDLNDFLSQARSAGYFCLDDLDSAVIELNGLISFLPKSDLRPLTPKDISLKTQQNNLQPSLIIDGIVMQDNLRTLGLNEQWLNMQLKLLNIQNVDDVFYGALNNDNQLYVYLKNVDSTKKTIY